MIYAVIQHNYVLNVCWSVFCCSPVSTAVSILSNSFLPTKYNDYCLTLEL